MPVWRDFRILLRSIWINLLVFVGVLVLGAGLLRASGYYPEARFFDLFVTAFHMAYLERVIEPGAGLIPSLLTFFMPVATILILGEGVIRVVAIYFRREDHQEEWDRMVAETFSKHTVICGVGELGRAIFRRLLEENPEAQVVLVDNRPDIPGEVGIRQPNVCQIQSDMTDRSSLRAANCSDAGVIILASGSDSANLEAGFKALELNPDAHIWIRLYRIGLAGLMDLKTHPNIHFFSPNEQAARSLMMDLNNLHAGTL